MAGPEDDDSRNAAALQRELAAAGHACELRWVAETGSTNSDLLASLRAGGGVQCLVAGHQSAGRGRRARTWHDDTRGAPLLCSLAWPLPRGCELGGLSLAVGVWLVQALQDLGMCGAMLKWPNDVLIEERKLAGVLVEVADTPAARWVVVGIGLNLRAPEQLPQAAGLLEHGVQADRWQALRRLLPRLIGGLQEFALRGFAPWTAEWNALHAWAGRSVELRGDGAPQLRGTALGVDEQGFLWLRTPAGRERVTSGDVSLRTHDEGPEGS